VRNDCLNTQPIASVAREVTVAGSQCERP